MPPSVSCSVGATIPHNPAVVGFPGSTSRQRGSFRLEDHDTETENTLPEETWFSTWETDSSSGPGIFEPHLRMHGDPPQPVGCLDIQIQLCHPHGGLLREEIILVGQRCCRQRACIRARAYSHSTVPQGEDMTMKA
ncbi:hypothetical protein N7491_004816 [Penicillium cf. griseofulvum]|nr:hypothetical protein N7491_004816 [Penicillium cf. griseofulvum]KAJ5452048.1 hypothetical protein N7445_000231 [Penicillium cf. griseofulvum]